MQSWAWRRLSPFALAVPLALAPLALAEPGDGATEAGFLVSLFKFVNWPATPDLATICFVTPSNVYERLALAITTQQAWTKLADRKLAVRMVPTPAALMDAPADAPKCQVLYLDSDTASRLWPFPVPRDVLTVSDWPKFVYQGGMVQFLWNGVDAYRIAINQRNMSGGAFSVSGALATFANRVDNARRLQY